MIRTPSPKTRVVSGQPSWRIATDTVEAYVTETGGHLGPVTFDRSVKDGIRPYNVAPWASEPLDASIPPILRVLRGDFFCLPFGGNATPYRGERHPVHGETANARWKLEGIEDAGGRVTLHASLATRVRRGRVDKRIFLVKGENVVYTQHVVSGMSGPMNLGHRAMIRFPSEPGAGSISASPSLGGQVFPGRLEDPAQGGYSCLKRGAEFEDLGHVPLAEGGTTDLGRYPAREGFEDLVAFAADRELPFAWTAVTFPRERFAWFALKDPRVLAQTILWISNGGRHYAPWNGRHRAVLGLEEVTSYFHTGLAESAAPNAFKKKGWPTALKLDPRRPLVVPYIQGVTRIPAGFDRVASIDRVPGTWRVALRSASRKRVEVPVDIDFLFAGEGW